jgi:endonuclease YncB( thermonuclease family)
MGRLPALVSMALVFLSAGLRAEHFQGKVVSVKDGDTIDVMHDGRVERVRLAGIDCPEPGQPFATKAELLTSQLAFGKDVTLRVSGKNEYGRTLVEVVLPDGRSLNKELVRSGLAWMHRQYTSDPELDALEKQARSERRGLWVDFNPTPPWQWRRRRSTPSYVTIPAAPDSSAPSPEQMKVRVETTVFVTRTGSKYHRTGCRFLRSSRIPMPLSDAKRNYSPCSVCNPQR